MKQCIYIFCYRLPTSVGFEYVEVLGRIIIGSPYSPSNAINLHALTIVIITKYIYIFVEAP